MSDFLYSSRPRPQGELRTILNSFLESVSASIIEEHGPWGSLAVAACPHDVQPLVADENGITVLLGWPVLHGTAGFTAAPVLDPGRRKAVHELLLETRGATTAASRLDGPFATLTIDRTAAVADVLTDRMGFIPLFHASPKDDESALVLGSHVDAVAVASARVGDIDLVSAADFTVHSTITYPRTLYDGVVQFPPASARRWNRSGWESPEQTYWFPMEQPTRYAGRAARALRGAFRAAVQRGCEGREGVGLLLSGGEDSRAVLGAIPRSVRVDAFIFGDWENREFRIARRIAEIYGAHLHFGQRQADHYLAYELVAPMLGTQHRYTDVHGYGLHRSLRLDELPIVFDGYLSDSLLKANYAHRPKRRLVRRASPLEGERHPPIIANAAGLREDLLREVERRRDAHRDLIRRMRPFSAAEWLVLWPFSMRATGSNIHGSRRLFRSYEPYVSNEILEIAAAVPQLWKRERLLFHRAMRPFLAPSWFVPHGRSKYPYFGPIANVPLGLGVKWARMLRDRLAGERGRVQGPWPELSQLVATPAMHSRRSAMALEETPFAELFQPGLDPRKRQEAQSRWTPERQLGFLQMVHLYHRTAA